MSTLEDVKKLADGEQPDLGVGWLVCCKGSKIEWAVIRDQDDFDQRASRLSEWTWAWMHLNVPNDGGDELHPNLRPWLRSADRFFPGVFKLWGELNESLYTQQPEVVAGKSWDLLEIKVFPRGLASARPDTSKKWRELALREAWKKHFCLRVLLSTSFFVTVAPVNLRERLLPSATTENQSPKKPPGPPALEVNPLQKEVLRRLIDEVEQEGVDEPNTAFLLKWVFADLLRRYDRIIHDLDAEIGRRVGLDDPSSSPGLLQELRDYDTALAHLSKMEHAFGRLFDHLTDPYRGAFQISVPEHHRGYKRRSSLESDQGVSRALQAQTERGIRLINESSHRVSDMRELYFSLETKKTNELLQYLTLITIFFSVAMLLHDLIIDKEVDLPEPLLWSFFVICVVFAGWFSSVALFRKIKSEF